MRLPYRIAGLWVRVALLVVLLWGALVSVLSMTPRERTLADFHTALRTGQVTYVIYYGTPVDLRWSTGPLFWYHADRSVNGAYTPRKLLRDLNATVPRPEAALAHARQGLFSGWPFLVPFHGATWLVGGAWIAALFIMIGTGRPRLGNRWAWFWLFTVGEVGAMLFLLLEPRSLWRGLEAQDPVPNPMGAGSGCVLALCLSLAIPVLVVVGLSQVFHTLLDLLSAAP
ncbi:hypothetical protein [Microbispora sp. NBRC 16548]|uniref:hypothetical protein n=1 Tax=Microbispora sp. NBRC 16548 TaxID=3030994 RepID=UPI0024A221D6|nr:hypothetical protein [Microbispora sp. NBRC 16548]GLX09562.1 hypothetical protein Misp03_64880 [Microbispora sp. NBRC 16548]